MDGEDEKLECGTPIRAGKGVLMQSAIRSVVCKLICIYPLLSRNRKQILIINLVNGASPMLMV